MKEKYHYIFGGQSVSQSVSQCDVIVMFVGDTSRPTWLTISVMVVLIIISGVVTGLLYKDNLSLHDRINRMEGEMLVIRDLISQVSRAKISDKSGMLKSED